MLNSLKIYLTSVNFKGCYKLKYVFLNLAYVERFFIKFSINFLGPATDISGEASGGQHQSKNSE